MNSRFKKRTVMIIAVLVLMPGLASCGSDNYIGSPKFFGETPKILGDKVKGMSKFSLKMKKTFAAFRNQYLNAVILMLFLYSS